MEVCPRTQEHRPGNEAAGWRRYMASMLSRLRCRLSGKTVAALFVKSQSNEATSWSIMIIKLAPFEVCSVGAVISGLAISETIPSGWLARSGILGGRNKSNKSGRRLWERLRAFLGLFDLFKFGRGLFEFGVLKSGSDWLGCWLASDLLFNFPRAASAPAARDSIGTASPPPGQPSSQALAQLIFDLSDISSAHSDTRPLHREPGRLEQKEQPSK